MANAREKQDTGGIVLRACRQDFLRDKLCEEKRPNVARSYLALKVVRGELERPDGRRRVVNQDLEVLLAEIRKQYSLHTCSGSGYALTSAAALRTAASEERSTMSGRTFADATSCLIAASASLSL
jgi:hypothetical protein